MRSRLALAVVSWVILGVVSPASAAVLTCAASGEAYPIVTSFKRASSLGTKPGRTGAVDFTVVGGVYPIEAAVVYLGFPQRNIPDNNVTAVGSQITPGPTVTAKFEISTLYQGYAVEYFTVTDNAGCSTLYSRHGGYSHSVLGHQPDPHGFDLASLNIFVVSQGSIPLDPSYPVERTDEQHYMNALTNAFLGRDATLEEMGEVGDILASEKRAGLTQRLAASEEWAGIVVDDIYQAALDRDPEASGRSFWVERLHNDGKTRDIAVSVYGSQEAVNAAGGDAGAFVDGLYNRILGRDPEPGGRAFWVEEFDSGRMQPWQLVAFFWESIEFRRQRVDTVYNRILGRPADDTGRAYWADRLLVEDDVALAALLASSDEFYNRASG